MIAAEEAVKEAAEWIAFSHSDPTAESIVDEMLGVADSQLEALEAIAPFAMRHGERDCIIELRADVDEIVYSQAAKFFKQALRHGIQVIELAREERLHVLELRGWLAFGRFASANGKLDFQFPKSLTGTENPIHTIAVTVYPLWEDDPHQHLDAKDLAWDKYRAQGHCCFCNRSGNAVRVRHLPSEIMIELHADQKEPWLRDKALQMLKSRLRFNAHPGERDGLQQRFLIIP